MSHAAATLSLDGPALAALVGCQRAAGQQEVCGLCAIDPGGTQHFLALANHASDPDRFETSAADEAHMHVVIARLGWRISAFVHTHVRGGPEMSEPDSRMFRRDALPWVIVAINGPHIHQRIYGASRAGRRTARHEGGGQPMAPAGPSFIGTAQLQSCSVAIMDRSLCESFARATK